MRTVLSACVLSVLLTASLASQTLVQPFNFLLPTNDTVKASWLPALPSGPAGAHGFVQVSEQGHFKFGDGTDAPRFVGVNIFNSACLPDSVSAITTAKRLRKLGVNLVRLSYYDYHNSDGNSILAPGNKSDTLSATQIKRFDWFMYQLKINGIYVHLVTSAVHGPRRDDGVWGWDSTYNYGRYIYWFMKPLQQLHFRTMTVFFNHVNPYTNLKYADEPQIALITGIESNSPYVNWINNRYNQASGIISYNHSRMIDTLFANFLRNKYGNTTTIRNTYFEGTKTLGPNNIKNGGFEAFTDFWTMQIGEGYQASQVVVQGSDVAPNEGANSMRIVVRAVRNSDAGIYMYQNGIPAAKGSIYRLMFKAKTDTAAGRVLRVVTNFGLDQTVNLTTSWQTFSFVFRSTVTDSLGTYLRFYCGRMRGDVFLDGVAVQDTGRDGLAANESLESYNIARSLFNQCPNISYKRMLDLTAFYDTLGRDYYPALKQHLRSIGVRVPIEGTCDIAGIADAWMQSRHDFTGKASVQWDFNGARPGYSYSDSTWVIRNYSVLTYRDQKIPEFSRVAITGKPFVAESYLHVFPNSHRSEMMMFYPAYASLQDWDGAYLYAYNDRSTEIGDRRRFIKDDFVSIMADPTICALLPQMSDILRNRLISSSVRTLKLYYDEPDMRAMPMTYSQRVTNGVEGSFPSVANMISSVRIDSFSASRHYTANDYYITVPTDDNIQSDTREITLDMTKGVLSVNTPRAQGGSGALQNISSLKTDNLGVTWVDGSKHITYWWTSLDTSVLAKAPRSLFTLVTRANNSGAQWTYGDSSFAKLWGAAPIQVENAKVGVNFYTSADTVLIYPLDTLGLPTGKIIGATKVTNGSWRVTIDLATEKALWFGVEQRFSSTVGMQNAVGATLSIGEASPNPADYELRIPLNNLAAGAQVSANVFDALGNSALTVPTHSATANATSLICDTRSLPNGNYTCILRINGNVYARRFVIAR